MAEALIGMANVYLLQQEYGSAIESLQQVLEQQPNSLEAHYALGQAYAQSGEIEKACEVYDTFMSLSGQSSWQEQVQKEMALLGCQ